MRSASVRTLPSTVTVPTVAPSSGSSLESAAALSGVAAGPPGESAGGAENGVRLVSPKAGAGDGTDAGGCAAAGVTNSRARRRAAASAGRRHRLRGGVAGDDGLECELLLLATDLDGGAGRPLPAQDEISERILQDLLDRPLERACPERDVEAPVDEEFAGFGGDIELDLLYTQPLLQLSEQNPHDRPHVFARERVEHDHVVDAVEELGIECPLEFVLNRALDGLELGHGVVGLLESEVLATPDDLPPAQVRGHDDDGVLEVHTATRA